MGFLYNAIRIIGGHMSDNIKNSGEEWSAEEQLAQFQQVGALRAAYYPINRYMYDAEHEAFEEVYGQPYDARLDMQYAQNPDMAEQNAQYEAMKEEIRQQGAAMVAQVDAQVEQGNIPTMEETQALVDEMTGPQEGGLGPLEAQIEAEGLTIQDIEGLEVSDMPVVSADALGGGKIQLDQEMPVLSGEDIADALGGGKVQLDQQMPVAGGEDIADALGGGKVQLDQQMPVAGGEDIADALGGGKIQLDQQFN
jgi:hypothetical protein